MGSTGVIFHGSTAMAMGTSFFTTPEDEELRMEYTVGYFVNPEGSFELTCTTCGRRALLRKIRDMLHIFRVKGDMCSNGWVRQPKLRRRRGKQGSARFFTEVLRF